MDNRERLILLNLIPDIGTIRVRRLREAFGSLAALCEASEELLKGVEGIGPVLASRLAKGLRDTHALAEEVRLAKQAGCRILTQEDAEYPAPLNDIPDPPLALYIRGTWTQEDQTAIGMVGSRRASLYGEQIAGRFAYDLALRGATIVSGLARGIDAAAHRGALKATGRTLAVLGNGLATIYPPEHVELANQIAQAGALISEYPMTMAPLPHNFPRRNRIVSGLSLGVVVVEAANRSGALITADCALEQGREVFAIPGKIDSMTSQGSHRLLKQGAKLVTSVEDILEELRLELRPVAGVSTPESPAGVRVLTDQEQAVLAQLSPDDPRDADAVAHMASVSAAHCAAALLQLELKRLVKQLPGKRFVRSTA